MSETETPAPTGPTITILPQASIHEAILSKINGEKFAERHTYVGGSEVGGCAREVAWKKIVPERARITDPDAAGRILAGQFLENAVVQLVRSSFSGTVRATGHNQSELIHPTAPLRCHPDGRLFWSIEWVPGMRIAYLDEHANDCRLENPPEGAGTMEVKTCGGAIYRKYTRQGLPPRYLDQTQTEMGLDGNTWTLLVLVNRENLSQFCSFLLFYDADKFGQCVARSYMIMDAANKVREMVDIEEMDPEEAEAEFLPPPEKDRGYCAYCDHANCPEKADKSGNLSDTATFPEDTALEVEVKAQDYIDTKPIADRNDKLKEWLKETFLEFGVKSAYGLYLTTGAGRTTVDSKKLEADFPDAYTACKKTGDPSVSLKIGTPKEPKTPKAKKA